MRTEQEMLTLILKTAEEDVRIRGVYMNGSRTNPNVPKDIFQDYDIVYVVYETSSFQKDRTWIKRFGEHLYMQFPEENIYFSSETEKSYGWLIQFKDGNRLDLHVETLEYSLKYGLKESLCLVLLDKEGILPKLSASTDKDYWVEQPTEKQFLCTCNEFWWCLNNVAKGLWREEVPYVQANLNYYIREELIKVLSWKIGIETNFSVSVGKFGKYMYRFLKKEEWEKFLCTYASYKIDEIWNSVLILCDLFHETALFVSERLNFNYNKEEADASRYFLEHVRNLPKDAKQIFSKYENK